MRSQACDEEGRALLLVAAAIAAGLADGRSEEDISVISALLNVIADQLTLLLAARERGGCGPCPADAKPGAAQPHP